jgi:3-oxoadipate enol-lactonase
MQQDELLRRAPPRFGVNGRTRTVAFTRANGGVVHFASEGAEAAHTLVFINSLGTDFRIWDETIAPLARRFRILRYDKRGHGLSELIAGEASMTDYASDLAALMDQCVVRRATIIGLSIGGLIAQELYRLRPDLVVSLVLCDTAVKIGNEEMWANRIGEVETGGIEAIADGIMQRWFSADFRARRSVEFAGWRAMLTRTPVAGYLQACGALRRADLRPFAGVIKVPTLCIVGEEDGSTPVALVRETSKLIGRAQFEVIAGAGHLPNLEKPDAVRALIEGHLREHAA